MNEVTFQEPATSGSVIIKSNKGDLHVELWSRECPKACRNFVQNCLEGYYNGTIFHRIIPGFIVQAGDPKGSGETCESVYGEPYPDELHTRLKFRYRGMIGVANAGKGTNTNGSQFFISLGKLDALNGQNTLFGKVVGNSVYTLTRIAEMEVDKYDRPVAEDPPIIIDTVVSENPFPDIVPRSRKPAFATERRDQTETQKKKPKITGRRTGVLSFAEEDAEETAPVPRFASAHDVLSDKSLAKESIGIRAAVQSGNPLANNGIEAAAAPIKGTVHETERPSEVAVAKTDLTRIHAEIELVTKALEAAASKPSCMSASGPSKSNESVSTRKRAASSSVQEDSVISDKLKAWSNSVSKLTKIATVSSTSLPERDEATTLHALIRSAEGEGDSEALSGGSWLKSAGSVKFAVDSKTAFEKFRNS